MRFFLILFSASMLVGCLAFAAYLFSKGDVVFGAINLGLAIVNSFTLAKAWQLS